MLGWEPVSVQRGYDQDGNQVPLSEAWEIVTETEQEWSDADRIRLLALAEYERGVCACGFHSSLTNDLANTFTFESKVCLVCRGTDRYMRIQGHADKKASDALGENAPPGTPLPGDGRRTFVRQMAESEVAQMRQQRDVKA